MISRGVARVSVRNSARLIAERAVDHRAVGLDRVCAEDQQQHRSGDERQQHGDDRGEGDDRGRQARKVVVISWKEYLSKNNLQIYNMTVAL